MMIYHAFLSIVCVAAILASVALLAVLSALTLPPLDKFGRRSVVAVLICLVALWAAVFTIYDSPKPGEVRRISLPRTRMNGALPVAGSSASSSLISPGRGRMGRTDRGLLLDGLYCVWR